ncbi:MAG: RNA polymerase sigma factor [Gaiellales bacterium]
MSGLVARCRMGDQDAWRELVEHHSRYVYAILMRGFRLPAGEAEDIFQDVFARVFERLDTLRDDDALVAWIGRLTRSLCVDHLRRQRETQELTDEGAGQDDHELEQIELAVVVREALTRLPEACGEIIERFFFQEQPYAQISAELDIPPGTVASRISRCLDRLRTTIDGSELGSQPSRRT